MNIQDWAWDVDVLFWCCNDVLALFDSRHKRITKQATKQPNQLFVSFSRRCDFPGVLVCVIQSISFIHWFHIGWNKYTCGYACTRSGPFEHIILGFVTHVATTNLNFAVVQCTMYTNLWQSIRGILHVLHAWHRIVFNWVATMITAVKHIILLSFVLHDTDFTMPCLILATLQMSSIPPKEPTACRT